MKVTCESCGSKYTIKDDKVRGKRVKIRCKGCKSPIVVDGLSIDGSSSASDSENAPAYSDVPDAPDDTGLASAEAAFPPAAPLGAAVERWSVNLSETDSRDMTTDEIVAAWRSGLVTDDAYIYKPGFDDWKPIMEVPELARVLTSPAAPDAFSPPVGKSPFAAAPAAAPRAAASGRRGDLFGGVAAAGGEDDVGHAAAPPMVFPSGDSKTGARNESSVLFSLDALKAGFAGPSTAPAAPSRNDDPFGLTAAPSLSLGGGFDGNQALFAAPPPEPKKPKKISLAPSAAPGEAAPAASGLDRSKLIMIAVAALGLLIAVGGVGFALGGSGSDKPEGGEQASLEKEDTTKAREGSSDKAADEKKADAEKKEAAEAKKAEEAAEKKDEKAEEKPAEEAAKPDAEKPAETAAATGKTTASATTTTTKSETSTKTTTKTEAPKADAGAAPFNKSAAISALSSAAANAAGCKVPGGPTGSGKAIVTFAPSGRVTSANVSGGKFGGSSVGGCVASRFRGARVPPFSGSPVTVSKSFTVP